MLNSKDLTEDKTSELEEEKRKEQINEFRSALKYIHWTSLLSGNNSSTEKSDKIEKKLCPSLKDSGDIRNIIEEVEKMKLDDLKECMEADTTFKLVARRCLQLAYCCGDVCSCLRFLLVEYALQKGQNPFGADGDGEALLDPYELLKQLKSDKDQEISLNGEAVSFNTLGNSYKGNVSLEKCFWHWFVKQSFSLYSKENLFDLFSLEQIYDWFGDEYFDYISGFYKEKFGENCDSSLIDEHLLKALSSIKGDCEFTGVIFGFAFSASVTSSFLVIVIPSFWIFLTIPVGTLAGYGIGKLVGKLKCYKIYPSKDCYRTELSIGSGYSSDSNMSLNKGRDSSNSSFLEQQNGREKPERREDNSRKKTNFTSSSAVPLVVVDDDNKNK